MSAIDKILEERLRERKAYFQSEGSRPVLLNDPETIRAALIQQVSAANDKNLVEAVAHTFSTRKNAEQLMHQIIKRVASLKKATEEEAKKMEADERALTAYNTEPYKILRTFYTFQSRGEAQKDAMNDYKKLNATQLTNLYHQLTNFDVNSTPLPQTYDKIRKPLQAWLLQQKTVKE